MGQAQSGQKFSAGRKEEKRKWEPPIPPTVGKKKKKKGMESSSRLPVILPVKTCKLKALRTARVQDYILMEEEFINAFSDETQTMPAMVEEDRAQVRQLQGMPMQVATLEEMVDDQHAIVSVIGEHYVPVMSFVDKDSIEPGCSVLVHNKTYAVVGVVNDDVDPLVGVMKVEKCPLESYADIGGLEEQIQEVKEAVEYPLSHPELYEDIGIRPPKGVIFYGEPGTGKTLLARAVANQTSATFLRVVGSELVQKYLGDGPKLVREIFRAAEESAPSIVFIDEIDAIGTKRYDASSSGEKEIQRTMLELLNQLDGFDAHSEVKVIMATNKIETLDPALIRPGRIDRKVEFPLPDEKTRKVIFDVHTKKMSLDSDVDLTEFILAKDNLSGAEIKAVCTEAGLMALRDRRMRVNQKDFDKAREQVMQRKNTGVPHGLYV